MTLAHEQAWAEMLKQAAPWWRVTVHKPSTGEQETLDVKAETEGKAKSTAMMFTALRFHGALATFEVEQLHD